MLINEKTTCSLFPTRCTLQKRPRAEEELIVELRKDLGLEDLGLKHDLEVLTSGQDTCGGKGSPCSSMDVPPVFEHWRRCDKVLDLDHINEQHVSSHEESDYITTQGCDQCLPTLEDDEVLADIARNHKNSIGKGKGEGEDRKSTWEFKRKGKRSVKMNEKCDDDAKLDNCRSTCRS